MARRLRRFSLGPDSSTKTMRVSKKPFSPVILEKTPSEMIWRGATPVAAVGRKLLADELFAGSDLPEPILRLHLVARAHDPAGHDRLSAGALPCREIGRGVEILDPLRETSLVQRREEPGSLQIVDDHAGNRLLGRLAHAVRHRHGHRLETAATKVDEELGLGGSGGQQCDGGRGCHGQPARKKAFDRLRHLNHPGSAGRRAGASHHR